MTVTINGTTGVSLCDTNSVPTAALQASAVTQPKVGSGVAGNGPVFYAVGDGTQSISSSTYTVVQFNNESFDTANCFSTSTYRFTPNVAGYYQLNCGMEFSSNTANAEIMLAIVKNSTGTNMFDCGGSPFYGHGGSTIQYANGTTDYFYVQIWQNSGSSKTLNLNTRFSGCLVRAA